MILNLKPKAEHILSEQVGFIVLELVEAEWNKYSTRVLIEKNVQNQREMFHVFMDIKKALYRV